MHSLLGLLCTTAFWFLLCSALFLAFPPLQRFYSYFLAAVAGLMFGYFMHLWEDSLTVGGVRFFTGIFSGLDVKISGTLHTDIAAFGAGRPVWERDIMAVPIFALFFVVIVGQTIQHSAFAAAPLIMLSMPLSLVIFRCRVAAKRAARGPL